LFAWLLDIVLPQRCLSCGESAQLLCASCTASLRSVAQPCCELCGAPTAWPVRRCRECSGRRLAFASARAAVLYTGPARPLLRAWKERGLRPIGTLAAEIVATRVVRPIGDVITPVPPDPVRQLARGRPARLLERTAPGRRQTGLGRSARSGNVRNAFRTVARVPAHVVLVDDVYTTGATASAAATALRRGGAASVQVVTFARTVR
jgi:predicted amidophosphoribosyltransferase